MIYLFLLVACLRVETVVHKSVNISGIVLLFMKLWCGLLPSGMEGPGLAVTMKDQAFKFSLGFGFFWRQLLFLIHF